ncbi:MAG: hypothetical protein A2Y97_06605, partial [Nitrospirae bacterium RBG_13_39_12]
IIPVGSHQTNFPSDKIAHFIIYAITAFIFLRKLRLIATFTESIILSVIISSFYGFAMEILQFAIPWRSFSLIDEIANICGASALGIIYAVRNYRRKNDKT